MNYFECCGWPGYVYPAPLYLLPSPLHYTPSYGPVAFPSYTPYSYGENGSYREMTEQTSFGIKASSQTLPATEFKDQPPQISSRKRRRRLNSRPGIRKPNKMKPERSALANITNQLLTFLYLKRKNKDAMRRLSLDLSRQQLQGYYDFAKELKQSMYGCVNEHRLGAMWLDEHPEQKLNYDILRRLSFYYLQNGVIPAVLTSQRMPPEAKPVHLQVRRKLLELLAKSRDREL